MPLYAMHCLCMLLVQVVTYSLPHYWRDVGDSIKDYFDAHMEILRGEMHPLCSTMHTSMHACISTQTIAVAFALPHIIT